MKNERLPEPEGQAPESVKRFLEERKLREEQSEGDPSEKQSVLEFLALGPCQEITIAHDANCNKSHTRHESYRPVGPRTIHLESDWLVTPFRSRVLPDLKFHEEKIAPYTCPAKPSNGVHKEKEIEKLILSDLLKRVDAALKATVNMERGVAQGLQGKRGTHMSLCSPPKDYLLKTRPPSVKKRASRGRQRAFRPDLLGYISGVWDPAKPEEAAKMAHFNRLAGEVKPGWKLKSPLGRSEEEPLLQMNFYMWQRNSRYGFLLTDRELFCLKRTRCRDEEGFELEVSPGYSLSSFPPVDITADDIPLTAPLALYTLCYLAMDDTIETFGEAAWQKLPPEKLRVLDYNKEKPGTEQ